MRIAIITETFLPSTNGIVTRLCQFIRWLKKDGHEVLIIAPDLGVADFEGTPIAGVPANTLFPNKNKQFPFPSQKVKDYLLDFQADLIHVVNPGLLAVSGIYYSKRLRLPLIASYHTQVPKYADYYHLPFLKPMLWWYFKTLPNRADFNLCTSKAVLTKLTEKNFKNIYLWDQGVDTNHYYPVRFDAAMRNRLTAAQKDKKLLLYVGRLAPENRLEKIREVFEKSTDYCLAIVGDGPHRAFLEQYFKDTDTVFTGWLHGDELASAYASADVFVFPSTTKTVSLVLLEAMASGLPIVAAKSGPTCEQVNDGITGLLYDPADQDAFFQHLSLLKDDQFRLKLAEQARTVSQMTGWETPSEHLLDFYKETVHNHTLSNKFTIFRKKSALKEKLRKLNKDT